MRRCLPILLLAMAGCLAPRPGDTIAMYRTEQQATPSDRKVPHEGFYALQRIESGKPDAIVLKARVEEGERVGFLRDDANGESATAGKELFPLEPGLYRWTLAEESALHGGRLRRYYWEHARDTGNAATLLALYGTVRVSGWLLWHMLFPD